LGKTVQKLAGEAGNRSPRVVLVGMMGSGKTTVGRLVAARLGSGFADTDEEVESRVGISVQEVFSSRGEEGFRRSETEALEVLLAQGGPGVVAVGGGAVLSESNRQVMRREATVVWLRASVGTLTDRVGSGEGRPLLTDGSSVASDTTRDRLAELAGERQRLYEDVSAVAVDTDGLSPEEVADLVVSSVVHT
jgi:shikimate kinase